MKIVHLNTERGWRGGERQTFWLARELLRRGHENWVACRPGHPLEQECRKAKIPVVPVNPLAEFDLWTAWRLRRFLRANTEFILHAHTAHAVGLGALSVAGTNVPFVGTRRVDFALAANVFSRWKYRRLDRLVAISEKVREIVSESRFPAEKLSVVPSGINTDGYPKREDKNRLRSERGFGNDECLIVNVAALVPHKDQTTLLVAVKKVAESVPSVRLLILGDGPLRNSLGKLADGLGLAQRVTFLGHRQDVLEYIALADLFVLSSIEEGLGTSLLDALALGVPVVATNAGGIPEIFGSVDAPELVVPKDPNALASGIRRVLSDPEECAVRSQRGLDRAAEFTVTRMTDRYEEIYKQLLK